MSFTLLDDFVVQGPEIKQHTSKTCTLFPTSVCKVNFSSLQYALTEESFERTGFWFLILRFPLTRICLPLGMANPFGSASIQICGAALNLVVFSSLQNKTIDPKQDLLLGWKLIVENLGSEQKPHLKEYVFSFIGFCSKKQRLKNSC